MPGGKAAVISAMLNVALSAGLAGWQPGDALRLGVQAAEHGDCAAAVPALKSALAQKPDAVPAWKALAVCETRTGQMQDAAKAFRRITELEPASWQAWNNLGVALAGLDRRCEAFRAIDQAERLSAANPQIRAAWMSAAGALASEAADRITAHQYQQARESLALVERALAGTAAWQNLMGYAEFKLNHPKPALEHLQKALATEPGNEDYLLDVAEFLAYYKADV